MFSLIQIKQFWCIKTKRLIKAYFIYLYTTYTAATTDSFFFGTLLPEYQHISIVLYSRTTYLSQYQLILTF